MSHTPGPWEGAWDLPENESNLLSEETGEEWLIRAADGTIVVGTMYYDGLRITCRPEDLSVLKAAPDLLARLKELVRVNEEWNAAVEEIIGRPPNWNDSYLDGARAAIAKAEGRDGPS